MQNTGRATEKVGDDLLVGQDGYVVMESMRWRTPPALVDAVARHLGAEEWDLDACAEEGASVAPRSLTADRSCLVWEWNRWGVQYVWMNPPYGAKGVPRATLRAAGENPDAYKPFPGLDAFLDRAHAQANRHSLTVACLVPASMDARIFRHLERAREVILLGRVRFLDTHGIEQRNPPGAHMVIVFTTEKQGPTWTFGLEY